MPRTISFLGSVALLVSSITGPSLVVIPLLFQHAGWLTPLLTFVAIALLSGAAALLVVEVMASIEGNEAFQASIEFTTIAHLFLGKRWHIVVQGFLYLAMQTLVVASLLESFQSMDAFLISVAHKTCAVSFTDGWVCVDQIPPNGSSAFSGYVLASFGTLITISLIFPLSLVHLVDNIIFQIASFIALLVITITWIVIFAVSGLNAQPVPVVGHDQSTVVGFVLSNFSFVTTIPAWVNNTHPSVNIRRAVWLSILISSLIYIPIGWMGGLALVIPDNATLLQVFATGTGRGALTTVARVSSYLFPLAVLITSIPVFTIVIRYNLLRGNICSNKMAIFWSAIFPWIIAIPFQTNGGIATILNWSSLVFTSPANLLVPFILYVISRRCSASAVLDANVPLEPSPIADVGTDQSSADTALNPAMDIPVVIITDSTDRESDGKDGVKTPDSGDSGETRSSETEMIPMTVKTRVSSPSKYRYYGQEVAVEAESSRGRPDRPVLFLDTGEKTLAETETEIEKHKHKRRRPSFSVSLSPTRSITHSSGTGMDEFLLMSPSSPVSLSRSHSVRSALSARIARRLSVGRDRTSQDGALPAAAPTPSEQRPILGSDTGRDGDVRLSMSTLTMDVQEPVSKFKAFPYLYDGSPVRSTHVSIVGCILSAVLVLIAIVYNIISSTSR